MKKTPVVLAAAALLASTGLAKSRTTQHSGPTHVKGSVSKTTGHVTQPHYRSKANSTQRDNWSTKGNTNPTNGKKGTRAPKK
jgi:hypothetical protein